MQYLHLKIVKEGKIHCKFNTYIVMKKYRQEGGILKNTNDKKVGTFAK